MSPQLYRDATMVVETEALAARAAGDEYIPVAISSEFPVIRTDWMTGETYYEVLAHEPGSIDLSRAQAIGGLPFILGHDQRDQFGLVRDVSLGADRLLRGRIQFSRAARAQEIRQDALDGVRTTVSVGYDPGEQFTQTIGADGIPVRRYTQWTPYEVSSVPVPADPTVGIGRALRPNHPPAPEARSTTMSVAQNSPVETPAAPSTPGVTVQERALPAAPTREATILSMCSHAKLDAGEARALIDSGKSVAEVSTVIFDKIEQRAKETGVQPVDVELSDKEQKEYSFFRAVDAYIGRRNSLELEVSDTIAKRMGRETSGFYIPTGRKGMKVRTQLSFAAGAGKGTEARETVLDSSIIGLMRAKSLALGTLGVNVLPPATGNLQFPRQTAGATASWVAEAPGSDMALSSATIEQFTMSPKTLQASTTISRQMIAQTDMEGFAMNDIVEQHRVAIDAAIFAGTGASNQPTGVLNATGVNLIAYGINGLIPTFALILSHIEEIAKDNAALENAVWVWTPGIRTRLRQVVAYSSTASPLWDNDNRIEGYNAFVTTNMPSTLTKGTSSGVCHGGIFGDFSQVLFAEWGAQEIIVDPYTLARRNLVQLTSIQFCDINVRQPTAFAVTRDALV